MQQQEAIPAKRLTLSSWQSNFGLGAWKFCLSGKSSAQRPIMPKTYTLGFRVVKIHGHPQVVDHASR